MKSLKEAIKEYFNAGTIEGTKPLLVFIDGEYIVSWYFSESTIKKIGGEVIL